MSLINFNTASLSVRVLPGARADQMEAGVGTVYRRSRDGKEDVLTIALPDAAPLSFSPTRAAGACVCAPTTTRRQQLAQARARRCSCVG